MAGYKRSKKYVLEFEDEEFEGLEVTVGVPSLRDILRIKSLEEKLKEEGVFEELCTLLGKYVKEWNLLDDDDQPVTPSPDALLDLDMDFVMAVVSAWTKAAVGVAAPLDEDSPSGETSLEASLPMETLSPSPES